MLALSFLTQMHASQPNSTNQARAAHIAQLLHVNPGTVLHWWTMKSWTAEKFDKSLRGCHPKIRWALDDNVIKQRARDWVRAHGQEKGKPPMAGADFAQWVNTELLPSIPEPEVDSDAKEKTRPQQISAKQARLWLHRLGFRLDTYKQAVYVDGHERADVRAHRAKFIAAMHTYRKRSVHTPPPTGQAYESTTGHERPIVIIAHDECIFRANDGVRSAWVDDTQSVLRPKTEGRGIMVSAFACEMGVLDTELLEYGPGKHWTSERMQEEFKRAMDKFEEKYPGAQALFLFDQSSNHTKKPDDALNASAMNVKPGGKQPLMRATVWHGQRQSMCFEDGALKGQPKGLKRVLVERWLWKEGMKKSDAQRALSECEDFMGQMTILEELASRRNHLAAFFPKFHCELNPMELLWAEAKRYARARCQYSFNGLRAVVPAALNSISPAHIRSSFIHCREIEQAYRTYAASDQPAAAADTVNHVGAAAAQFAAVEQLRQTYKSHRRPLSMPLSADSVLVSPRSCPCPVCRAQAQPDEKQ